ncbi:hypothetical protein BDR03DRAFT_1018281 [Suillus americanus]|nr:hypothetical protein BDR03DRAFT_1018281 [Suillus americanus]
MRGHRRGQNKARAALPAVAAIPTSAAIPTAADIPDAAAIPTTIPTTIPAMIPAAAAANATTLQNPHKGEAFDLNNISGDEEEPGNLPAPIAITSAPVAIAPAGSNTSPLQTTTSTVRTDPLVTGPLVTGNLKQPKGPTDISHFYQIDPDMKSKICIPCKTPHKTDATHKLMVYTASTSSSAPHTHAFTHHTDLYLEAAERFGWRILDSDVLYMSPTTEYRAPGFGSRDSICEDTQ